jgi:hypothetical protein
VLPLFLDMMGVCNVAGLYADERCGAHWRGAARALRRRRRIEARDEYSKGSTGRWEVVGGLRMRHLPRAESGRSVLASRVFWPSESSAVTLAVQAPGAHGQAKLGQYRRALDRIVVEALGRRCLAAVRVETAAARDQDQPNVTLISQHARQLGRSFKSQVLAA